MLERGKCIFVGVDVHKATHTAVIVDPWGEMIGKAITFNNNPAKFPAFVDTVSAFSEEDKTIVFGLEDVGGYGRSLAVFLIEQGFVVKSVNPALSYAERLSKPTFKKNDDWDAECVAKVLVRSINQLPDANPSDIYWTIGQMVGRRDALIKTHATLKNQLHGYLSNQYPSYKKFFSEIDGKTALAFWQRYPSPCHLKGVSSEELKEYFLTISKSCSQRKADAILSLVEADGQTQRSYQSSRDMLIQSIVRQLSFIKDELKMLEKELASLISQLGYQLTTMPGINIVTASALIAEIEDINRFPNQNKLASYAGVSPIFIGSGGTGKIEKSRQGNRKLNSLFYELAVQQVQFAKGKEKKARNPVMRAYYERKIEEGKSKGQALVCVMRVLVRVIYGMMKNKTAYQQPEMYEKQAV
jgi:transposase